MKLLTSISLSSEPMLEKWARYFRFGTSTGTLKHLFSSKRGKIRIVDYGCGQDILFYKFLQHKFPDELGRVEYIGLDPLIKSYKKKNIQVYKTRFERAHIKTKADLVVMFALLEHVDDPPALLRQAISLLDQGGVILVTTPSWVSKPILEFLSFGIGVISQREIAEHKRYFSRSQMLGLGKTLQKNFRIQYSHEYFELGLNNLFTITRLD